MQACCDVLIFVHKLIHGAGLIYGNYVNTGKSHWELYCRITTFSPTRELRCLAISLTASALPCVIRHESLSFSLMALFASSCRFRTAYFFIYFSFKRFITFIGSPFTWLFILKIFSEFYYLCHDLACMYRKALLLICFTTHLLKIIRRSGKKCPEQNNFNMC